MKREAFFLVYSIANINVVTENNYVIAYLHDGTRSFTIKSFSLFVWLGIFVLHFFRIWPGWFSCEEHLDVQAQANFFLFFRNKISYLAWVATVHNFLAENMLTWGSFNFEAGDLTSMCLEAEESTQNHLVHCLLASTCCSIQSYLKLVAINYKIIYAGKCK